GGEADPVDRVQVEQAAQQDAELVTGTGPLGREPPVIAEPVVGEEPQYGLRVSDVDGEQHRPIVGARHASPSDPGPYSSAEGRGSPMRSASASAVRPGSSPSARSSSTVTSPEV